MLKKFLSSWFIFVFFLMVAHSAQAGLFAGNAKFYTIESEHFIIHYQESLTPLVEDLRDIAETSFDKLTKKMDWTPKGKIQVVFNDKQDVANGLASLFPYHYILVYAAKPTAHSELGYYKDYLTLLFHHELTHILHIDQYYRFVTPLRKLFGTVAVPNGATPSWMREGMAVYEETALEPGFGRIDSLQTDMVLRTSYLEQSFPSIDQIAGLSREFPAGSGPYLFGGEFMQWLADNYGEDRIYEYQKEYAGSPFIFALNNKSRRVFGKSFNKLYKEFKQDQVARFEGDKQDITEKGVTKTEVILEDPNLKYTHFTIGASGEQAYSVSSLDNKDWVTYQSQYKAEKKKDGVDLEIQEAINKSTLAYAIKTQMSYSYDGRFLAFDATGQVEKQTLYNEVYIQDMAQKKVERVKIDSHKSKSMRVRGPDFSPKDGGNRWIVMIRSFTGTDQLYLYDRIEKKGYVLTDEPKNTHLSNPRFSPDGEKIVVSRKDPVSGFRDIVVYSKTGQKLKQITRDIYPDLDPIFSPDGSKIYFSSFRSGVANIHAYNFYNNSLHQLTNTLTGFFGPMPDPQTGEIYVREYSTKGDKIVKFRPIFRPELQNYILESAKASTNSKPLISSRNFTIVPGAQKPQVVYHPADYSTEPVEVSDAPHSDHTDSLTHNHAGENYGEIFQKANRQFAQNPFQANLLAPTFADDPSEDVQAPTETTDTKKKDVPSIYKDSVSQKPDDISTDLTQPEGAKKYNPLKHLFKPKYLMPSLGLVENAVLGGIATGSNDPLYRHSWAAFVNYRSDAKFVGGGGTYIYSRYKPNFYVGGLRYAVNWGFVNNVRFFEERNMGYAGVSYRHKKHLFNGAYFYDHRSALTNLSVNIVNMKPQAGVRWSYDYTNVKKYPRSISFENGVRFSLSGDWTSSLLGSSDANENRTIRGDLRTYLEMPWSEHHVLAFRGAVGWSWGTFQQFGNYRLGGPFGEIGGVQISDRVFPLRGLPGITYGGDEVFIFSGEYRLPLSVKVNKGLGTMPVYMNKWYMNFFVDGGDIRFKNVTANLTDRLLVSVGAEMAGDFMVAYGLPLSMRVGYGVILTNKDRLGTLTDSWFGQSLRNGSFYFQLGTMF